MPFVVGRWWFPSHKGPEVTKIYQNLKFPERVGERVAMAQKGSKRGIVGMSFVKVTPENIAQAMTNMATILQNFAGIEGYEGNVEVWADMTEVPREQ